MTKSFEFDVGYAEDGEKIVIIRFYATGDCTNPSTGEVRMSYKTFGGLVSESASTAKLVLEKENDTKPDK